MYLLCYCQSVETLNSPGVTFPMSRKETPAAPCSFSLPLSQFPSKISSVAGDEPSVLLGVGIAWKGEGKAWTEVLEPWVGRENAGMQGGHVGSHELLMNFDQPSSGLGARGAGTLLPYVAELRVNKYWCIVVVVGLSVLRHPLLKTEVL